ncbi:centromere protein X isoform X5 [Sus scrofa]|uniref:centromere protein X isoform X5 n=1 Tax=Sus scrofa TaxID=9823 RepID=UPI000A2B07FC|nr:centromere protein X isoform X5 [Sus scrofa]
MEESGTGFRKELVSKLLHLHFKDDKTKEAAVRSVRQAQAEDLTRVDVDQLEKVLPQLKGQELLPPGSPPLRRQASVPAKRPSPCHALPGCGRWGTEWEPGPWGLAPGWCPPLCTPRSSRAPTGWQEHTQEEWASCQPSERPPHTSRVMGRCHQRPSWAVTFQPLDTPQKMLP